MSHIFVAFIEVKPLPGCELDPKEFAGAALRCYVSATSAEVALSEVGKALAEDHFELTEVHWCVADDQTEWEEPEDEEAEAFVEQALETRDVVYGRIDAWAHDDDT